MFEAMPEGAATPSSGRSRLLQKKSAGVMQAPSVESQIASLGQSLAPLHGRAHAPPAHTPAEHGFMASSQGLLGSTVGEPAGTGVSAQAAAGNTALTV